MVKSLGAALSWRRTPAGGAQSLEWWQAQVELLGRAVALMCVTTYVSDTQLLCKVQPQPLQRQPVDTTPRTWHCDCGPGGAHQGPAQCAQFAGEYLFCQRACLFHVPQCRGVSAGPSRVSRLLQLLLQRLHLGPVTSTRRALVTPLPRRPFAAPAAAPTAAAAALQRGWLEGARAFDDYRDCGGGADCGGGSSGFGDRR